MRKFSKHVEAKNTENNLLLVGRWHGITRDQRNALRKGIKNAGNGTLIFVITAADQNNSQRHPLTVAERREVVEGLAKTLGRPYRIFAVNDIAEPNPWVEFIGEEVKAQSNSEVVLTAANTKLVSANPDVLERFSAADYKVCNAAYAGVMPFDMFGVIANGGNWRKIATKSTQAVYDKHGLVERVRELFASVLTGEGELSVGRDFQIYVKGMEVGMQLKLNDMFPWIVPGFIVDEGCGSGLMLKHLSALYASSTCIGVDLSTELLRIADAQTYPNNNVSVVRGNIIEAKFPAGTVSTLLYSSVMHEVRSYTGYKHESIRAALRNAHTALKVGGRIIIRDGIKPAPATVWMRLDTETEARFRRFAVDFKKSSNSPGVRFEEREHGGHKWFITSMHEANEFLSKKDYLENWDIEVNEEFGSFELHEWVSELETLSYRVLEARSYLNDWIETNRYEGKAWLHADAGDEPGALLPFPDSTAVIVAEKI